MVEKTFNLSGGCHCGSVRYTIHEPPLSIQHCHCESLAITLIQQHFRQAMAFRQSVALTG